MDRMGMGDIAIELSVPAHCFLLVGSMDGDGERCLQRLNPKQLAKGVVVGKADCFLRVHCEWIEEASKSGSFTV